MKEKLKIAGYAQRGVVPLALGVAVTMWLWNALIPEIVGWKAINHGQSLGLLVLLRLLFRAFRILRPRRFRPSAHVAPGSTAACTRL